MPDHIMYNCVMKNQLESFVHQNRSMLNQMPGLIGLYTTSGKLAFCNQDYATVVGYTNEDQAFGKSYSEIPSPAAELAQTFIARDNKVFLQKKEIAYLTYCKSQQGEWSLYLGNKRPIYDEEQNVIGLFSQKHDITNKQLVNLSRFLVVSEKQKPVRAQFSCIIVDNLLNDEIALSKRQLECLYYLLRGKSARIIAEILGLSPRTVENYFAHLKTKLNCQSTSELIEKSIQKGYLSIIPRSILDQ